MAVIGIDLDDTLIATSRPMFVWMKQHYGEKISLEYEDLCTPDWTHTPGFDCTSEQIIATWHTFYKVNQDFLIDLAPLPRATQTLKQWKSEWHELHIVTARHEMFRDTSQQWVDKHFGAGVISALHFCNNDSGISIPKIRVLQDINASLFLEDSPPNILPCLEMGITTIMITYPWNHSWEYTHPLLSRVQNWEEARSVFYHLHLPWKSS